MKKSSIIIMAVVLAVVAVVVIYLIRKFRNYKRYDVTDDASDYMEIYHIEEVTGGKRAEFYQYFTGAASVMADTSKIVTANVTSGAVYMSAEFIPVLQVKLGNGKRINFNPATDYIMRDTIIDNNF